MEIIFAACVIFAGVAIEIAFIAIWIKLFYGTSITGSRFGAVRDALAVLLVPAFVLSLAGLTGSCE